MVTLFNRTQLCVTQNLKQYANITAALNAADIQYYVKALSRSSPAASAMGTRGAPALSRRTWNTTIFTVFTSEDQILMPPANVFVRLYSSRITFKNGRVLVWY